MTRRTGHRILNTEYWLLLALTLLALFLRVDQIETVPPGMRVDELSNSLVVSQLVLEGQPRFFFPEAEGHEGLWHVLQAGFIAIFGRTFWAFRGVSIILGTLTIPLTFLVGKQLFDSRTGLLAAALVSVSFWSLMYSRVATRHIAMAIFMLGAFYLFARGVGIGKRGAGGWGLGARKKALIWAGIVAAVGLYTYFAAWVTPVVMGGFVVVCALFFRPITQSRWRNILTMFALILLLALPLLNDIRNIPETADEGRVSVVAQPIHDARAGDFSTIWEHVKTTFSMFHQEGDGEFLYNVPERPVFAPAVAVLLWVGVLLAFYNATFATKPPHEKAAYLFLILWWLAGISPAFVSVPPSSYGHTIAAHPAVYLLLALSIAEVARLVGAYTPLPTSATFAIAATVLVVAVGLRDYDSYFREWPMQGSVRFLYHSDMNHLGRFLHDQPQLTNFGISGTLAGPWERMMLELAAPDHVAPRWFNQERAVLLAFNEEPASSFAGFPQTEQVYGGLYSAEIGYTPSAYTLQTITSVPTISTPLVCFENGLCIIDVQYETPLLDITWLVAEPLDLPPITINSFPPAPGKYDGPRLSTFAHLWNESGIPIAVDDGFWVDPVTLQQGDLFRQRHILIPPDGTAVNIAIGLYDPFDGQRTLTTAGIDHFTIPLP